MGWPDLESFIPAPLRGGPIPSDVHERARDELFDAWRRYVARRVHGAPERAIGLVAHHVGRPFGLVFDGQVMELATPVENADLAALAVEGFPRTGMIMRQGGVVLWRESLTPDRAAARWRELGGDEAFQLEPSRPASKPPQRPITAYALVRRGGDQARVELSSNLHLSPATRAWAARFGPYLRRDVRLVLAPPS